MRSIAALVSLSLFACDGCDKETGLRREETRRGRPLASAAQTDDSIQPVYPKTIGEAPELVARLCEALHGLPRRKRAECCNDSPGVLLTSECERNLTGAVASGGVELEEQRVIACEEAMSAMHSGCDWIGPWQPPVPPACLAILRGRRGRGEECRSNLECEEGLRCAGAGPTDRGVCSAPPPAGSVCGTAVDPLAVYARQSDADERHPQCLDGYCDRTRCVALVEDGGSCRAGVQCESQRCIEGTCAPSVVSMAGLRCAGGVCREPKSLGEACVEDGECKSACDGGRCAMRCSSPAIVRGLIKTKTGERLRDM